jgi:hypothetical protein
LAGEKTLQWSVFSAERPRTPSRARKFAENKMGKYEIICDLKTGAAFSKVQT